MSEIPEHLLKRSKAAKASKTGDSGGDDAAPASSGDAAPVAAASAAPVIDTSSLPNLDPAPEPPKPEPAYVTASKKRTRIPVWAMPVVAALPIWAYSFAGTMQQVETEDPLFVEGEIFYSEKGCSGCHGATGGGGSGYAFANGEVLATFPSAIDHMVHVARGSSAIQGEAYGSPDRPGGQRVSGALGQMPAQEGAISLTELEIVVFHERAVLGGEEMTGPGYEEWMDHMREAYESGDETAIDLELLLACADPAITPGAGETEPAEQCPGPAGFAAAEEDEAALSE